MQAHAAYPTDSIYPSYFYPDTQPLPLSTVARLRGIRGPDLDRAYRYCELGCGTGLNVILAAALNPVGHFTGVDINREHIELARSLARDMGVSNIEFHCRDLQGFVQDKPLPFDIANCHGMWSWVAPAVQRSVLEFVARHLKPKGLFCLHYMCHPGSTSMIPVHKLFRGMARPGERNARAAVARGLEAVERLLAAGYFDDQPILRERLRGLKNADPDALAHELLSEFYSVHHAGDIHWLAAQAGLSFIGASEPFYNTDPAICIPGQMHALLGADSAPAFIETLKDMASRRPHRSDVFQKNAAVPSEQERRAALDSLVFLVDADAAPDFPTIATPLGPMTISDDAFMRLAELAQKKGRIAFRDYAASLPSGNTGRSVQALRMMQHAGLLRPEQAEASKATAASTAAIDRLLATRQVGLRLDRDSANARFLPAEG